MLSFAFKQAKRNLVSTLAVILFAAIVSGVLCGLQAMTDAKQRKYDEVYASAPVTLTVCNLTGTKTDDLNLAGFATRAFTKSLGITKSLAPYVKDVQIKMTMPFPYSLNVNGAPGNLLPVVGLTSPEMDRNLSAQNGQVITYFDGYGDYVFAEHLAVCVVPAWMMPEGTEAVTVSISFMYSKLPSTPPTFTNMSFRVVGTYEEEGVNNIYVPYSMTEYLCSSLDMPITADALRATVNDNYQMDAVRECAAHWFEEPSMTGEREPWRYAGFFYRPYALRIDDSALVAVEEELRNSMRLNEICTTLVIVFSAVAAFFIAFLTIRARKREISLMRSMGVPTSQTFLTLVAEQMACVGIGTVGGGLFFLWNPPLRLLLFLGIYCAGISLALLIFLNLNLLSNIKEDE